MRRRIGFWCSAETALCIAVMDAQSLVSPNMLVNGMRTRGGGTRKHVQLFVDYREEGWAQTVLLPRRLRDSDLEFLRVHPFEDAEHIPGAIRNRIINPMAWIRLHNRTQRKAAR